MALLPSSGCSSDAVLRASVNKPVDEGVNNAAISGKTNKNKKKKAQKKQKELRMKLPGSDLVRDM